MSKVSHDPPLLRISAALYDWGFWHLRKCHHLLGRSVTGMDTDGTGSKEPRTVSYLRIPGVRIRIVSVSYRPYPERNSPSEIGEGTKTARPHVAGNGRIDMPAVA
jgi:hypothetical protein